MPQETEFGYAITDDHVKEAEARIGPIEDRSHQAWNTVANADAIRHFCLGIGDDNPHWLVEPPGTFLFSVDSTLVFAGLRGFTTLGLGTTIRWHERLRLDDKFHADVAYTSCRAVTGGRGWPMMLQTGETTYADQDARVVASAVTRVCRYPSGMPEALKYPPRDPIYSSDEIASIMEQVLAEKPRGAEPRYWEDVRHGDKLGTIVKGPLSIADMVCWYAGGGVNGRRVHRIMAKEVARSPEHWLRSDRNGTYNHVGLGHLDREVAHRVGMPGPYDNPMQRTAWLAHLVTDWAGDAAFLKELRSRMSRPVVVGDTNWITGVVTRTFVDDDGDHVAALRLRATNQLGERSTVGCALVLLPTRSA
jgi:hypothetical protein